VKTRYRRSKLRQTCRVCADPNVDLHHRTYIRLGDEKMTDLEPLCREHHEAVHDLEEEWRASGVDPGGQNLWTAGAAVALQSRLRRRGDPDD